MESLSAPCRRLYEEFPESTLHVSSEEYLESLTSVSDAGLPVFTVDYAQDPDNVAFVVDVVSPGRLPWQKSTAAVDGMIEQIKAVEALEFDILLPGHAANGTKADATETREYLEELRARVQAEIDAGKSDEEIIASIRMPDYADWANYEEWLPLNVEGVLSALR